jgi:hypothetical protein
MGRLEEYSALFDFANQPVLELAGRSPGRAYAGEALALLGGRRDRRLSTDNHLLGRRTRNGTASLPRLARDGVHRLEA